MVDVEVLSSSSERLPTFESLLAGFMAHPSIDSWRYSESGPPEGEVVEGDWFGYSPGWVLEIDDSRSDDEPWQSLSYSPRGGRPSLVARSEHAEKVVRDDTRSVAHSELPSASARERRLADYRAGQTADATEADVYITRRPYVHETSHKWIRGVDVLSPEAAVPIIALYLRLQEEFKVRINPSGQGHLKFNKGLYYWVGTRQLLPGSWRYFSASVRAHDLEDAGASPLYLAQSVLQRVERAIRQRDAIHWALNRPQNNDTADDAAAALDNFLYLLMGAFDASARLAHVALGLSGSIRSAGWQREGWFKKLSQASPHLGALLDPTSNGGRILSVVNELRNSVHGEALQAVAVGSISRRESTLIGLPAGEMDQLIADMDTLGGATSWGVLELLPGQAHIDPGDLTENLLPHVLRILDRIMVLTPVEALPSDDRDLIEHPPAESDAFREENRISIQLQLGIGDSPSPV